MKNSSKIPTLIIAAFIINTNLQIYLKWNWNQQRVRNVLGLWIDTSLNVFCMPDIKCIYTVSCIYCIYMWLTLAQSVWPIPTNLQWICASVHISVWWRAGRASDTDRCFAFWEMRSWMSSAATQTPNPRRWAAVSFLNVRPGRSEPGVRWETHARFLCHVSFCHQMFWMGMMVF